MHLLMTYAAPPAAWHCCNGWHHGGWWIVFPILWLLIAALVVALVWRRGPRHDGGDSPRRILGERFARGEISADEYRQRLAELQ